MLYLVRKRSNNHVNGEIKMRKNKLVIAMAVTTLLGPAGAMAAKEGSFDINYNVEDQITIDITGDINLSNSDSADGAGETTNIRGSTTFCVGMAGASAVTAGTYTLAASSSNNSGNLVNGPNTLSYTLKYLASSLPVDDYGNANAKDIVLGEDPSRDNSTEIALASCTPGSTRNGRIWVNIADAAGAENTGQYTDTVTLTVAVQ